MSFHQKQTFITKGFVQFTSVRIFLLYPKPFNLEYVINKINFDVLSQRKNDLTAVYIILSIMGVALISQMAYTAYTLVDYYYYKQNKKRALLKNEKNDSIVVEYANQSNNFQLQGNYVID